ncbi:extracellular solute-binding protein [Streptomyces sp. HNM0663]|uniref:Extracellular solute-binding protein n=1 Tax=Streptomyces chengmaiensis TaxID=3040919 RepID=A0ABT6HZ85_9ACTN|nr:extracellular solute-binding protein [Streptomyces chengmaiensis]MDH2394031.1 extracellular solute-binding protein [Streptomyces chengmaiensis]
MPYAKPLRASAALALITALAATGCSTTSDGSDGDAGSKRLTYWSMWTQTEPQAQALKKSIAAFTKKTGIKVDVQWQGREVLDKLGPAMLSGKAPDLVDQSFDRLLPVLAANGKAEDLSPVLSMDVDGGKKVSEVIPQKYLDVLPRGKDGTPWMMPYEAISVSIFYNGKDPLVTAPPKTWDELLAICKAAKAKGKACIGTDADQGWATQYWFDYLLNRNGGSLEALSSDKTGAAFKNPVVLKAAQQAEDLVKNGYLIKGYDATKYPEQQGRWVTGKSVFFLMGSWLPSEVQKLKPAGYEFKSVTFPTTVDATKNATDILPIGFSIPKGSKNAKAAQKFIAFFLNKDQLSGISTIAKNVTPRPDVAAPAELQDVAAQLRDTSLRLPGENADTDWQTKVLSTTFSKLWLGKISAKDFVTQGAKASADYWKAKG